MDNNMQNEMGNGLMEAVDFAAMQGPNSFRSVYMQIIRCTYNAPIAAQHWQLLRIL